MLLDISIEKLYTLFKESRGVSSDSRSIKGGELFFALKGENFDGNLYAAQALEKGASYAVMDKAYMQNLPVEPHLTSRCIFVDDVLVCLQSLATYHRQNSMVGGRSLPILALTGTNGKTTTKELIKEVLSSKYNVCATQSNLNNDIGVPLTLLRIKEDTQIAIIEMGANHPEDIKNLAEIVRPDYGLITNVGKAHLLGFGDFAGVKKAKSALYEYLGRHGGTVFANVDDGQIEDMLSKRKIVNIIPYGKEYWKTTIAKASFDNPYLKMSIRLPIEIEQSPTIVHSFASAKKAHSGQAASMIGYTEPYQINSRLIGSYNAENILAAISIGRYFGVDLDECIKAIENYSPQNNRSQMLVTSKNKLIVDAYNANPSSMEVALKNFIHMSGIDPKNKIVMLGAMKELGESSYSEHCSILDLLLSSDEIKGGIYLVGEDFSNAFEEYNLSKTGNTTVHIQDNEVKLFLTSEALASHLQKAKPEGYTILIKGSRSTRMERTLAFL